MIPILCAVALLQPGDPETLGNPPSAPATTLSSLQQQNRGAARRLRSSDKQDPIELPRWFRAVLRKRLHGLPTRGQPQYPPAAVTVLRWLEANPSTPKGAVEARIAALQDEVPQVVAVNERRRSYPKAWEVRVPKGTALDKLRTRLDQRLDLLPDGDLEDQTAIPIWFRVYLRQRNPDLPKSGPHQYPRSAPDVLEAMLGDADNPRLLEPPKSHPDGGSQ